MNEKPNEELNKKITSLVDEEKYKDAFEMANEAQKDYPNDASLWFLRARALNGLSRIEESLAACDKAIEYGYDKPAYVYSYKGRILADQEHFEESLKEYDKSLSIDSTSVDVLVEKANLLFSLKGGDAPLLPIANRIIQLDPKRAGGWNIKAFMLHLNNEHREAEKAVNKALEIDPNFASALAVKASILGVTGRKNEASKLMKKAVDLDPDKNDNFVQGMMKEMTFSKMGGDIPTVEEAKRSLTRCWILPIIIGGYLSLVSISSFTDLLSTGAIVTAISAIPVYIILILLGSYAGWSFYWGWGPVWRKWRNFFDGWGFFSGSWFLWIIVIALFIYIPFLIAIVYGAFVGIGRHKKLKLIVANN